MLPLAEGAPAPRPPAEAVAPPPTERTAHAIPLDGITIDGRLDDWPEAMAAYPIDQVSEYYKPEPPEGPEDLTANFHVGYDAAESLLYLAIVVRDEDVVVLPDRPSYNTQDLCEVHVDSRPRRGDGRTFARYAMVPGPGRFAPRARRQPGLPRRSAPVRRRAGRLHQPGPPHGLRVGDPRAAWVPPRRPHRGGDEDRLRRGGLRRRRPRTRQLGDLDAPGLGGQPVRSDLRRQLRQPEPPREPGRRRKPPRPPRPGLRPRHRRPHGAAGRRRPGGDPAARPADAARLHRRRRPLREERGGGTLLGGGHGARRPSLRRPGGARPAGRRIDGRPVDSRTWAPAFTSTTMPARTATAAPPAPSRRSSRP